MKICQDCGTVTAWPRKAAENDVYDHEMPDNRWEFAETIADILSRGAQDSVLDIGCGKGGFLKLAKDNGILELGIDFNESNIEAARRRGLNCHQKDLRQFTESEKFASVTSFHVIEHLDEPFEFLKAIRSVLQPDGAVYLSFPCQRRDIVPFMRDIADYPPHHMNRISDAGLRCLAERSGFVIAEQRNEARSVTWKKATSLAVNHALDAPRLRQRMAGNRLLNLGLKALAAVALQPVILWRLWRYRADPGFTVLYKLQRPETAA